MHETTRMFISYNGVHLEERRKKVRKEALISGKKSISESSKVSPSLKR